MQALMVSLLLHRVKFVYKRKHTVIIHITLTYYIIHIFHSHLQRFTRSLPYAISINGRHAKKQWDRVHESEVYEALLHCFPLFSCLISLACMHLVPLFYACLPFMNMVYKLFRLIIRHCPLIREVHCSGEQ